MSYESGMHNGAVWGHNAQTCAACRKTWQLADFRPSSERLTAHRTPARDPLIGASVLVLVLVHHGRTLGYDLVRNVRGRVWSQADPTVIGSDDGDAIAADVEDIES